MARSTCGERKQHASVQIPLVQSDGVSVSYNLPSPFILSLKSSGQCQWITDLLKSIITTKKQDYM